MAAFKVNISKSGDAIKFVFTDSNHYLYGDGEIEVPVNSLSLVVDESNMVTFKKAASNDIFLTFDPANSNLSDKAGVINFYKTNMVGSTGGGGGGGITSGEVQTMIDNSISGLTDEEEVEEIVTSYTYSKEEVDSGFSTVNQALSGKADTTAVTASINAAVSGKADTSAVTAVQQSLSGKQDTLVSGTNIKTINNQSLLGSGNINISGGSDSYVYYSENTEDKTATIHIEDTDGGTVGEVLVDGSSVDMYASMTEEDEDNGSMVETHSDINGNSAGVALAYEKNIDDAEATHSYLNVEEGLISMEVMADEDSTTLDVYSNGVTINGENVVTEDQLADYQPVLSAGTGIDITDNVISATGGSSVTIATAITSSSTNTEAAGALATYQAVSGKANVVSLTQVQYDALVSAGTVDNNTVYNITDATAFDPATKADASALTQVEQSLSGKQDTLSAGTGIEISGNVISATGGGGVTVDSTISTSSTNPVQNAVIAGNTIKSFGVSSTNNYDIVQGYNFGGSQLNDAKFHAAKINGNHIVSQYPSVGNFSLVETSAITTSMTSSSTDAQVPSAKAVYDTLGGLKFVQCTQAEYDALVSGGTVDSSTIYFINNVV